MSTLANVTGISLPPEDLTIRGRCLVLSLAFLQKVGSFQDSTWLEAAERTGMIPLRGERACVELL